MIGVMKQNGGLRTGIPEEKCKSRTKAVFEDKTK